MKITYFNYLIIYHAQKPYMEKLLQKTIMESAIGNMRLKRTKKIETFEDIDDVKNFIETECGFQQVVILNVIELQPTTESEDNTE